MQKVEVSKDYSFGEKKFEINGSLVIQFSETWEFESFWRSAHKMLKLVQHCCIKMMGLLQKMQAQFLRQKNKGVQSDTVPSVKRGIQRIW